MHSLGPYCRRLGVRHQPLQVIYVAATHHRAASRPRSTDFGSAGWLWVVEGQAGAGYEAVEGVWLVSKALEPVSYEGLESVYRLSRMYVGAWPGGQQLAVGTGDFVHVRVLGEYS